MHLIRTAKSLLIVCVVTTMTACGSMAYRDSAPRNNKIDFNSVPDATPKFEPFSKYGNPEEYEVFGIKYRPMKTNDNFREQGIASWYGTKFHGKRTSSGEEYDMYAMTAAHKTLPLPTYVKVKNLDNGKQIVVKVNDRGPFHEGRIIDLSYVAAHKLGIANAGTGRVEIEAISFNSNVTGDGVFVQVGAYRDQENAQNVKMKLAEADIRSDINPILISARKRLYRVRIGPFPEKEAAERIVENLRKMGLQEARVFLNNEF